METPSLAEIVRGSYLLATRDSWSSELRFHVKDSPFSSTVPKLVILDHTATFLCQKLCNFCLNIHFKIGSQTLCQITSISLMSDSSLGILATARSQFHLWGPSAGKAQLASNEYAWADVCWLLDWNIIHFLSWKLFLSRLCTKWWQISSDVRTEKAFVSVPAKKILWRI